MSKTIDELREEINEVDEQLVRILAKRMDIVKEIGKLKKENNLSALDEKRWQEVLERTLENAKKYTVSEDLIKKIYEKIHATALEIEKKYE